MVHIHPAHHAHVDRRGGRDKYPRGKRNWLPDPLLTRPGMQCRRAAAAILLVEASRVKHAGECRWWIGRSV